MAKFRKKPVVIEAMQFTDTNKDRVFHWVSNGSADFEDGQPILKFRTIHGDVAVARIGDWVVSEPVPGYFYPCKPDIFDATYEPVDE